jgi:hypothetical protein
MLFFGIMESEEYIALAVASARLSDEFDRCISKSRREGVLHGVKLTCTGLAHDYRDALNAQIEYLRSAAERSANVTEALQAAEEALRHLERDIILIEVG